MERAPILAKCKPPEQKTNSTRSEDSRRPWVQIPPGPPARASIQSRYFASDLRRQRFRISGIQKFMKSNLTCPSWIFFIHLSQLSIDQRTMTTLYFGSKRAVYRVPFETSSVKTSHIHDVYGYLETCRSNRFSQVHLAQHLFFRLLLRSFSRVL